jgi:hypothetical protein
MRQYIANLSDPRGLNQQRIVYAANEAEAFDFAKQMWTGYNISIALFKEAE